MFDYDGTIVDTLDVAYKAYNTIASGYNLSSMKSKRDFVKLYENNFYSSLLNLGINEEDIQKFNRKLRDMFLKCGYSSKLFPGMKRAVNKLAEKNMVVVITSNITSTIQKSVKKAGLNIHEILGGDKEPSKVKKILFVKERHPNAEIYYIGDTKGDILEGREAGVKTIGVTWGYHSKKILKRAKPDFIVDKSEELLEIFEWAY